METQSINKRMYDEVIKTREVPMGKQYNPNG